MTTAQLSPERVEELRKQLSQIPYAKLLGMQLGEIRHSVATLTFEIREDLKRNNGIVHGGAIASLIDTATAFATMTILEPGQRATTVDLSISFLRPLSSGQASATGRIVRAGRRIVVTSAEVLADDGTLVATALSTYIKD